MTPNFLKNVDLDSENGYVFAIMYFVNHFYITVNLDSDFLDCINCLVMMFLSKHTTHSECFK